MLKRNLKKKLKPKMTQFHIIACQNHLKLKLKSERVLFLINM